MVVVAVSGGVVAFLDDVLLDDMLLNFERFFFVRGGKCVGRGILGIAGMSRCG